MIRFGNYTERWEAEGVARALRAKGHRKVGIRKISNYHYTVTIREPAQ